MGVGKSGFVAQCMAANLNVVGTVATYLDPVSARRGDLMTVNSLDTVVMLSKSGTTEELLRLVPFLKAKHVQVVAMTCKKHSQLGELSDVQIFLPLDKEICRFNLAPLSSPAAYLLFTFLCLGTSSGLKLDSTSAANFPALPQCRLLVLRVCSVMNTSPPVVQCGQRCLDVLTTLNNVGMGFVLICRENELVGTFSDGDLRRSIDVHGASTLYLDIDQLMIRSPRTIDMQSLVSEALSVMDVIPSVSFLPVVSCGELVGCVRRQTISDALLLQR